MKFSKLDLLTLLISLFLFSSCKDSSSIGLDINPNDAVTGTLLDTVTVTSRTVKDDVASTYASIQSYLSRYPLGAMDDAVFGKTTAGLALAVNLPSSTTYSFGSVIQIDSAVLVMPYSLGAASAYYTAYHGREFYGDSTAVYSFTVNQLTDNLSTQDKWLSNKIYAAGDLLGSFSGKLSPNTPVKVTDVVSGAADTILTTVPEIRIKLTAAMIQSKIAALDSLNLTTNEKFNQAFKGLKVAATATGTGGIALLNFTTANSNLEIYYKKRNATTSTVTDTVVAKFPIVATTNAVAASVTHDYTNTPVATQLNTPGEYQTTYLQSMSGVRTKISFPYIKDLVNKIGSKIVISKAELVIDPSDATDSIPFKIPPRLALYRTDIAQQRVNVADNNPYNATTNPSGDYRSYTTQIPFGGYYDYTAKSYKFVITNYIQDLIDGKVEDYGTYIGTTSADTFNLYPFANTAGRVVIGSFNNTDNKKIRLNIYYVKTNTQ